MINKYMRLTIILVAAILSGCGSPENSIESCIQNKVKDQGDKLLEIHIDNPLDTGKGFAVGDVSYKYYDSSFEKIRDKNIKSYKCWTDSEALNKFKVEQEAIALADEKKRLDREETRRLINAEREKAWADAEKLRLKKEDDKKELLRKEFDKFSLTVEQSCLDDIKKTIENNSNAKVVKTLIINHHYAYNRKKQGLTIRYTLDDGEKIVAKGLYCSAGKKYSAPEFHNKLFSRP